MDAKAIFMDSLYDEQLGFFCAHEYSSNLEELLEDELNVKQFTLFKNWKEEEKEKLNVVEGEASLLMQKMDRLEMILEKLTTRFDSLDQKNQSVDVQVINSIGSLIDRIAGIETVQANILFKMEAVEKGQTNLETFVNGELSNNVKSIMETVKKNNASQNGFAAAVEAVGKEMAVTKEAILSRISNMQTQSYNDLKPQSNSVSEPLHKPIHRTCIAPCQTTPPLPQKQSSVHLLKSLRRRMYFKTIEVPCVEILYNYDGPHIEVKKGEIFGLLEDSSDKLWKIGRDGKTDFVPRTCCQKIVTRSFSGAETPRMMDVKVPI